MSDLFIVLQQNIPGFDPYVKGKSLSKEERRLDRLAKQHGVTPLMDFFSIDPEEAADFLEIENDALPDLSILEPEGWFKANKGLQTINTLIQAIKEDQDPVKDPSSVLAELEEWKHVLEKADSESLLWHAAVDY